MARSVKRQRRYLPLYVLLAVTIVPVAAAYISYYFAPPAGRTNYGTLLEPQRPVPALSLANLDGTRFDFGQFKGKWIFAMVDGSQCYKPCAEKLLMMRQQRNMTGRDRDRVERVWLITDDEPLQIVLMREYEGTHFVRAPLQGLGDFLVLPDTPGSQLQDHIWLIDPRGNSMLRWPKDPEISGVKRDIAKLLKISAGWIRIDSGGARPRAQ
ncbi:MAG TPA: cytochrome C oxidase subunit I [Burkholderiaceae bacterium]|nr:cytochrome C oxidase subunit I [Burkholderiaceae bacterium]